MRLGKPLHQLVCLMVTLTLLVSSVGAVSFHDGHSDNDTAFSQKQSAHNATSIVEQHTKFGSTQLGHCCNHGCHTAYHFLGLINSGFNLPETNSHIAQLSSLTLPNIFLLSWRFFKPPRQVS